MSMRLCCGVCHVPLEENDMVFVDMLNTVVHQGCYSLETNFEIKDVGSFKAIMDNYPPVR